MSEPSEIGGPSESQVESQTEYYKSLVTDDEVVAALIKDSKRRDGTLPPERMKPNLNFFQRTISNLVSNNSRIDESQDNFKTTYTKENEIELQVLEQIRLENEAATHQKPTIDFEVEKDVFLKTSAISFQKSSETYSTLQNSKSDVLISEKSSNHNIALKSNEESQSNKQQKQRKQFVATKKVLTKDFLRKELEKINKKIETVKQNENTASSSNKSTENLSKTYSVKKLTKTQNSLSPNKANNSNLSKEELLKLELAALDAKIQEKLSKLKTEDSILILDKEEAGSDVEIVNLDSSDEGNNKQNNKSKQNKIKILQNIEIPNVKSCQDSIRNRMISRLKNNNLNASNSTIVDSNLATPTSSDFVCTKCGSCKSNQVMDKKPCTAIKCETIELSSSSSGDLELVSVKIEPKSKKKKKKIKNKRLKKDKTPVRARERTYSRNTKGSRDTSSSSDSRSRSWDREREDRDKQRKDTYKARKQSLKSTIRDRTKSRDSRERSLSRERRANFRERDKKRSPSRDRRARSFSKFSTGASYDRYIKEGSKSRSRSRSRSGSRKKRSTSKDSRHRDSSTDSEQERYQAHLLAQQRFEERARREYWMNRIIREYQNRYRIPRIPQRHGLVERRKEKPPAVQSKVVVIPRRERSGSSGSDHSISRERRGRSSSSTSSHDVSKKRDSSSEKSPSLDRYNLENVIETDKEDKTACQVEGQNDDVSNNKDNTEKTVQVSECLKNSTEVSLEHGGHISTTRDEQSPTKKVTTNSDSQCLENGEICNTKDTEKKERKKKRVKNKKKEKTDKDKKENDRYVWKQVEIASNVTLHLGTECD